MLIFCYVYKILFIELEKHSGYFYLFINPSDLGIKGIKIISISLKAKSLQTDAILLSIGRTIAISHFFECPVFLLLLVHFFLHFQISVLV